MYPTRRFVDADNSCLFSSISYLFDKSNFNENSKFISRQLLVNYLEGKKIEDVVLGEPKESYIEKMLNPVTWGGAIELNLFSEMYQTQIVSIDIQHNRLDIFGQDKPYIQRCFVLYNGIHYDPLVMATTEDPKDDITLFDESDDNITISFQEYAKSFKDKGDYVDLSNSLNLKCQNCQVVCQSQEDALEHGVNYGHWEFDQVKS